MKFTTFFTQIMFLNTMGALGIWHVINIMGYVRDIPDSAYFTSWQLGIVTSTRLSFGQVIYRPRGCINEAFLNYFCVFSY